MAGEGLFASGDISLWRASLDSYSKVLQHKEKLRNQKGKKSGESLIQLDDWYQQALPQLIAERKPPHLTHDELSKLMRWKLMRGKFRPRLTELVQQNKPEDVEKVTGEAIKTTPRNLEAAVKHLCQLKAVGPATASAVLCAACPKVVPFMADESVLSVPGLGKLDYTLRHYVAYASKIQQKAKQLSRLESKSDTESWSCHDVGKALWTYYLAQKFNLEISAADRETDSDEELVPKAKRMKTDKS